jgi:hypothetical protein
LIAAERSCQPPPHQAVGAVGADHRRSAVPRSADGDDERAVALPLDRADPLGPHVGARLDRRGQDASIEGPPAGDDEMIAPVGQRHPRIVLLRLGRRVDESRRRDLDRGQGIGSERAADLGEGARGDASPARLLPGM